MEKVIFTPCSCVLWEVLKLGVISYRQAFKVTNQSDLFVHGISTVLALSTIGGPEKKIHTFFSISWHACNLNTIQEIISLPD